MNENAAKEMKIGPPRPAAVDLSNEIEQSIAREQGDRITVVRLFGDCYRCNWWAQDKTPHPFWLASGTIRKSQFLRVTKTSDRLHVEHVAEPARR
jgi:hypothetical protein